MQITMLYARLWAPLALSLAIAGAFGSVPSRSSAAVLGPELPQVRYTDHAQYRVQVRSDVLPVPMRQLPTWRIHISDASGMPVRQAVVQVSGGMPEHHHGLPTQPRVTELPAAGDYLVNGVRFSMTGRWVLILAIRESDGHSDTVTFSFVL
ncbi:FixH family protein [soil metagenome]